MLIFFDTEFTGLHSGTTLVSIGLVSDSGDKFYGEFTDYKETQADEWIRENVISHTLLGGDTKLNKSIAADEHVEAFVGSKAYINYKLRTWLERFDACEIQLVSDVCHYDMYLMIDLFGGHVKYLPDNMSATCHDINQDIARFFKISDREAFDKSREEILENAGVSIAGHKHNALYDAEVIRQIYYSIKEDK